MFTGLIEEVGKIKLIKRGRDSLELTINGKVVIDSNIGDSIAINGVCQTVTSINGNSFSVDVLKETLKKTTIGLLKVGSLVNLERALTLNKPLGGHFVLGHVQGLGKVIALSKTGQNCFININLPSDLISFMIPEGSISINGVSLTISEVKNSVVRINVIPHTLKETTLNSLKIGDNVNIEPDILIKGNSNKKKSGITMDKLKSWGY